ncbi:MAG: hypothetical protein J6N52_10485 [Clostridia bacterium]|nr:hypothetical protein [Clostridia bacterium]
MEKAYVDFNAANGRVKPMHAVNNGPVYKFKADQRITNMEDYKAAGIPYARNHDASFFATYGGSHTVDTCAVFPDFDADPYDEASYDFVWTDEYLKTIELAGTKTFYRLGSKIEHGVKKYGTLPPKDFHKWAVICEHIIRHYNYGWADGFHMDIEYWEIWNEPDLDADDADDKRTWGGTAAQFYELYNITAKHLKSNFPELKIGGPACANLDEQWLDGFFKALEAPLDFFSWHRYAYDPKWIGEMTYKARKMLDDRGFADAESILNEWNYVRSFVGDDFLYSLRRISDIKGAAFTAAVMSECQNSPLDMLMYYDARPCAFNGLWKPYTYDRLKGYYPFVMFNSLYMLKNSVCVSSDNQNVYICAAKNDKGSEGAVLVTYFNDDDNSPDIETKVGVSGFGGGNEVKAEYYMLDEKHDLELIKEEFFTADKFSLCLNMPLYSSMLIKLKMR